MVMKIHGGGQIEFPNGEVQTGRPQSDPYMLVRDEKPVGTGGGTCGAGVQTRTLNTVVANTIEGASLSANQVTLPAGTYRVRGASQAYNVDLVKSLLYNVTDAVVQCPGLNVDCSASGASTTVFSGRFTIASPKIFEFRINTNSAVSEGLGRPVSSAAAGVEVYAELEIWKEQ